MGYFTAFIKPASSLCNMRCGYCFYCDTAARRDNNTPTIMTQRDSELLVDRVFDYCSPGCEISFLFQGGEPTLAGQDYFAHFTQYADRNNTKNFQLHYGLQTNGLLLDDTFCDFLAQHRFLTGLSLDGPRATHDSVRLDAAGRGTFARAAQAAERLKARNAPFNILTVVTAQLVREPDKLFAFYQRNGLAHVQLIPCLAALGGEPDAYTPSPQEYAVFLKRMFALWLAHMHGKTPVSIRQFDNLLAQLQGRRPEQCGLDGVCHAQFVVESDLRVYPCDFYCLDAFQAGNLHRDTITEIGKNAGLLRFLAYDTPKHPLCASCPFFSLCGGGCKRYRSFYTQEAGGCPLRDFYTFACSALRRS